MTVGVGVLVDVVDDRRRPDLSGNTGSEAVAPPAVAVAKAASMFVGHRVGDVDVLGLLDLDRSPRWWTRRHR